MNLNPFFYVVFLMACCDFAVGQEVHSVWIDTDMGNDFDDELAISYALGATDWQIEGISTTHWRHEGPCTWATADSSFVLVQELLQAAPGRPVRVLRGMNETLGNVYGEIDCVKHPAVDYLISVARAHSPDRPLYILGLGSATNIAAALCQAPDIRSSIRVVLLAGQYDVVGDFWNKNEFNVQNDLSAFDYLLSQRDLDIYVMPANIAERLQFAREWLVDSTAQMGRLGSYLQQRWGQLDNLRASWTAYDLALMVAIAQPQWVGWTQVSKPPENGFGNIWVATYLDIPMMEKHLSEVWTQE